MTEQSLDQGGRYRLDSLIATGGMGEVWRAHDAMLDRPVAIKLLKAEYADDDLFRSRFASEARHAAALSHPGIAAVYDVGESNQAPHRPFLVMELVDGQPLNNLIRPGAPMDPAAVRDLLAQVGDALGAAHRSGIVHRDVKPGNLLVTPQRQVKVTDFGIARAAESVALTQTGQVMGTPQYLSPEQAEGGRATAASDVYALAVVAFECLAGRRPFEAESPVATALAHLRNPVPPLPPSVPDDLAAVVRKALSKKPEDRYADGTAFAAALRDPATAAMSIRPGAPTPPTAPVVPYEPATQVMPATTTFQAPEGPATSSVPVEEPEQRPVWPLVVGALLLVGLLFGAVVWWINSGTPDAPPPDEPTQSPTPTTDEPTDEPIEIDADEFVGRDARDVIDELEVLGLLVSRDERSNSGDETPYEVISVNPTGTLREGDRLTVTYWGEAPDETPTPEPTPDPTPTETPTPTPTPTPEPTPDPTPTETPDPTPTETPTGEPEPPVEEPDPESTP